MAIPVTHNVRSFPVLNPAFNFGQPPQTEPRVRVFERAEREIEIQCDFHLWMHAYIFVMDHPFYCVSDDSGTFAIEGLPPGEYTLESWHEKLGKKRTTVKVGRHRCGGRELHVSELAAFTPPDLCRWATSILGQESTNGGPLNGLAAQVPGSQLALGLWRQDGHGLVKSNVA